MREQVLRNVVECSKSGKPTRTRILTLTVVTALVLAGCNQSAPAPQSAPKSKATPVLLPGMHCKNLFKVEKAADLLVQLYRNLDSKCLFEMKASELQENWGIPVRVPQRPLPPADAPISIEYYDSTLSRNRYFRIRGAPQILFPDWKIPSAISYPTIECRKIGPLGGPPRPPLNQEREKITPSGDLRDFTFYAWGKNDRSFEPAIELTIDDESFVNLMYEENGSAGRYYENCNKPNHKASKEFAW